MTCYNLKSFNHLNNVFNVPACSGEVLITKFILFSQRVLVVFFLGSWVFAWSFLSPWYPVSVITFICGCIRVFDALNNLKSPWRSLASGMPKYSGREPVISRQAFSASSAFRRFMGQGMCQLIFFNFFFVTHQILLKIITPMVRFWAVLQNGKDFITMFKVKILCLIKCIQMDKLCTNDSCFIFYFTQKMPTQPLISIFFINKKHTNRDHLPKIKTAFDSCYD